MATKKQDLKKQDMKKQDMKKQDRAGGMDAVALLKKDHDDVTQMFEEFESADEDRKFELAAEICQALTIHATIEEEIFYPQAREAIDAEDLMLEAEVEHDSAKYLIERIQEGEVDETQLSAMIKVLKEYVGHHIDEEQRKMFPRVQAVGTRSPGDRSRTHGAQAGTRERTRDRHDAGRLRRVRIGRGGRRDGIGTLPRRHGGTRPREMIHALP